MRPMGCRWVGKQLESKVRTGGINIYFSEVLLIQLHGRSCKQHFVRITCLQLSQSLPQLRQCPSMKLQHRVKLYQWITLRVPIPTQRAIHNNLQKWEGMKSRSEGSRQTSSHFRFWTPSLKLRLDQQGCLSAL